MFTKGFYYAVDKGAGWYLYEIGLPLNIGKILLTPLAVSENLFPRFIL